MSEQVDQYVQYVGLMLRIEQCYGMYMYCTLYYVPCKWHTSDAQKGCIFSNVWCVIWILYELSHYVNNFLSFLWEFDMWHVTLFGRNALDGLCICISQSHISQLNHTKKETANDIIYTLQRVKLSFLMYFCHFPHTVIAVTELQLVPSIVINCWWHKIPS